MLTDFGKCLTGLGIAMAVLGGLTGQEIFLWLAVGCCMAVVASVAWGDMSG